MKILFAVPGQPNGKGRPKFARQGTFTRAYTPEKTVSYENLVKIAYGKASGYRFPDRAMIYIQIRAYYTIPKSVSLKKRQAMLDGTIRPIIKPDYDNIGKIVCDALNGIAYRDDSQIVDGIVRKFYSDIPRVEVLIKEV